jgi:DivIVA domain-containing protein
MTLTPEDVKNKRFTPVRLREGYDMGEVDQFLDEVESELQRLHAESSDLRDKLAGASTATPQASTDATPEHESSGASSGVASKASGPPMSVRDASGAAARMLELATRSADELVAEAKNQADQIVAEARTKSERLDSESRSNAEQIEADARARAGRLDEETEGRRTELFGRLESDKENLTRELEDLRTFEREYRSRLKTYFEAQLRALDGETSSDDVPLTPSATDDTPRRLRELLSEDEPGAGADDAGSSAATS